MSDRVEREQVLLMPANPPKPRVCIFAAFNAKYAPLADIARPNWTAYAKRHGYAVRFYPQGYHEDPAKPETFGDKGRFEWYYDLRGHCEIVMYLDIDSLFMNMDIRIEDMIGRRPFYWTYDDSGPLSGLMIMRTDEATEKHLRYAYTRAATENNVRHGRIEPNGISDQDSMRDLMWVPPFRDTFQHCVPAADAGHCYPENWEPGKWVVTFPGRPVADKLEGMRKYANLT